MPLNPGSSRRMDRADIFCILLILFATLGGYSPSLFGGRVLLPADIVPLMRPWSVQARERFPDHPLAVNQMHGPIFEYYSWRHYARERIRAGEVPLWNPYELGGNVLLANSQSAVLYPPNILLYLLPLPAGINAVTALHTFLTGLFMFGLMRSLRRSKPAALTAAFVWMFCGLQMAWLEFQTPTAALCWLPGVLWAWEALASHGARRAGVLGGAAGIALTLLAGHLQFAFYVLLAFTAYAFSRSIWPSIAHRDFAKFQKFASTLMAIFALGIALSACTLLPVMEMARFNFRSGKTEYASTIGLRMPPEILLTLFQPNIFGSPRDYAMVDSEGRMVEGYPYWGAFDYIEYACYLGIPGLILALVGASAAFRGPRGSEAPERETVTHQPAMVFVVLAALGLLLALGTPLCAVLFYGVPGYGQFNATGRAISLFCFGMAALSAFGYDALAERDATERQRAIPLFSSLAFVILCGLIAFPGLGLVFRRMLDDHWLVYESSNLRHFVIFSALTAGSGWLMLHRDRFRKYRPVIAGALPALAVLDLFTIYAGFNPQVDPTMLGYETETTNFLKDAAPGRIVSIEQPGQGIKGFIVPNFNAVYHLREVQGADSLHTQKMHRLLERVVLTMEPARGTAFPDPNTIHVPSTTHPLFDLLNVQYVTSPPNTPCPDPTRLDKALDAELAIWRNRRACGPAWVVGKSEIVAGLDSFLARLGQPDFDPRQSALLSSNSPPLDPSASGSPVQVTEFAPHDVMMEVDARASGLLIASEIAFPGWRAWEDGKPVAMLTADHILRAVPVSVGRHRVEMRYVPTSYLLGLYLTCMASAVIAALTFWLRRGTRKPIL